VSALIDSTLDELDRQVRELRRELTRIDALRRQLSPSDDPLAPAARIERSYDATRVHIGEAHALRAIEAKGG
jgi:hypothetical protein